MNFRMLITCFSALTLSAACSSQKIEEDTPLQVKAEAPVKLEKKEIKIVKTETKSKALAYTCLVGKDKRLVKLDKSNKRCEVHYTKAGQQNQMAWAESSQNLCHQVFNNIRTNIEKGGFKCSTDLNAFDRKTAAAY